MNYDCLKLDNQLCFPLYAASKEVIKRYRPYLDALDLTYTQYIVLLVLWEHKTISIRDLGDKLMLDSGTLTPVVKSLGTKGYVVKCRDNVDERIVNVCLTEKGIALRDKAVEIPAKMSACVRLSKEEAITLYNLLHKLMSKPSEM